MPPTASLLAKSQGPLTAFANRFLTSCIYSTKTPRWQNPAVAGTILIGPALGAYRGRSTHHGPPQGGGPTEDYTRLSRTNVATRSRAAPSSALFLPPPWADSGRPPPLPPRRPPTNPAILPACRPRFVKDGSTLT